MLVRVEHAVDRATCDLCEVSGIELSAAPRRPPGHRRHAAAPRASHPYSHGLPAHKMLALKLAVDALCRALVAIRPAAELCFSWSWPPAD